MNADKHGYGETFMTSGVHPPSVAAAPLRSAAVASERPTFATEAAASAEWARWLRRTGRRSRLCGSIHPGAWAGTAAAT